LSGQRTIPLDQFFVDYLETSLKPGELVTEVVVPDPPPGLRATYLKHTTSTSTDWPALGVAAFVQGDGGVANVRLVLGSVESKTREIPGVADLIRGKRAGPSLFREIGEFAASQVEPIEDGRASPWYKKELIKVYVRRALEQIWTAK
jgi:carbon-monoxide dehydrogenase medium subunit